MPINQVGNISVPESRLITVQVWDESLIQSVEKAIRNSELGLNPMIEGLISEFPSLNFLKKEELKLLKVASKYSEEAKNYS